MPGIYGWTGGPEAPEAASRFEAMAESLRHHPWYVEQGHVDPPAGLALGRTHLGTIDPAEQPARSDDGQLLGLLSGEILDHAAQRRALEAAGCRFRGDGHAELLLRGYEHSGHEFLRGLHGAFAGAIWDGRRRRLVLVNDRFGMRPLYYARTPERLVFASEIKALLADPLVSRALNPRGIAQFFTFGHLLNQDTFYESIEVLPAAGWLEYEPDSGRLAVDRYWRLEAEQGGTGSTAPRPSTASTRRSAGPSSVASAEARGWACRSPAAWTRARCSARSTRRPTRSPRSASACRGASTPSAPSGWPGWPAARTTATSSTTSSSAGSRTTCAGWST